MEVPSKHDCLEDHLHWDGYHERRRPGSHTPVIHIHCAGQPDMVVFPSIVGIRSLQSSTNGACLTLPLRLAKITGGETRQHKGRRCRGRGLSQDPNLGTSLSPKGGAIRVEISTGRSDAIFLACHLPGEPNRHCLIVKTPIFRNSWL